VGTVVEVEYRRAVREQEVREFETLISRTNKWFRVRCYPAADGGVTVYFLDITQARVVEEENQRLVQRAQESEQRLSAFFAATTAIIWTAAADGQFTAPQPSWEAYTGQRWPVYGAWGRMTAIHPEDLPVVMASWHRAITTLSTYEACRGHRPGVGGCL
jgi:PAS domain-containing protein